MASLTLNLDDGFVRYLEAKSKSRGVSVQSLIVGLLVDQPAEMTAKAAPPVADFGAFRSVRR